MKAKRPKNWIRLCCEHCGRDDYDGITPEQLGRLIAAGEINGVYEVQPWEESIDTSGKESLFQWETHNCECRECTDAGENRFDVEGWEWFEVQFPAREDLVRQD